MYTNNSDIPITFAVWLAASGGYDLSYDPKIVSVTDLLSPIRSLILTRRIKQQQLKVTSIDIANLAPSKLGTSVHESLERAWLSQYKESLKRLGYPEKVIKNMRVNPTKPDPRHINVFIEKRSTKKVSNYVVSGKFDFVIDGVVRDAKTTKTYNWISGSNKKKYQMQGSMYRWLNPGIIFKDYMFIDYAFTDWSPLTASIDKTYPQERIMEQKIPLIPIADVDQFVEDAIFKLEELEDEPQENLPECTPDELWQKPATWAYYRKTTNKNATKLYDNAGDAHKRLMDDGNTGKVIERLATPTFCTYCDARAICMQAQRFEQQGLLTATPPQIPTRPKGTGTSV